MLDESAVARSESGGSVSHIVGYGLLVFLSQLSGALQKVFHAQCQFLRIEWLVEVSIDAHLQSAQLVFLRSLGSNDDDRDMIERLRLLDSLAQSISIHPWHHEVGDDKVGNGLRGKAQALLAIFGNGELVTLPELHTHIFCHVSVVLHYEHERTSVIFCHGLFVLLLLLRFVITML